MIYRFKIWFEDEEDIIRWIDLKPSHSFLDFHHIILQSIAFKGSEPASFYISNDRWAKGFEITLQDMGFEETDTPTVLMNQSRLKDFINDPHQKFVYVYDFMQMWTLHIELQQITDPDPKKTYPFVYKSEGVAPKQHNNLGGFDLIPDNEFDNIAADLIKKGSFSFSDDSPEQDELGDHSQDEDEDDDFGPEYGEGFDENDKLF